MHLDFTGHFRKSLQKHTTDTPIVIIRHMFDEPRSQDPRSGDRTLLHRGVHVVMPIHTPITLDQGGEPISQSMDGGVSYRSTKIPAQKEKGESVIKHVKSTLSIKSFP